jgi:hypothetical protein
MSSPLQVLSAVYGALCGGPDNMHACNVTNQLQAALDAPGNGGVVNINNETMGGDPCPRTTKSFGAVVSLNGVSMYFACQEGQTVDFFHSVCPVGDETTEGASS